MSGSDKSTMAFQHGYSSISPNAPNEDDFPLFSPYHEQLSLAPSFPVLGAYADHIFDPNSFDFYAAQNAYTVQQTSDAYQFGGDHHSTSQPKALLPAQSSAYSPATSTAHSFDQHPSLLSSTSDSGASAQSTISSAMASPSMSGHNTIDDLYHLERIGKGPSFTHQGFFPDIYSGEGFETNVAAAPERTNSCVGELQRFSSSQPFSYFASASAAVSSPLTTRAGTICNPAGPGRALHSAALMYTEGCQGPSDQNWSDGSISPMGLVFKSPPVPASLLKHSTADARQMKGIGDLKTTVPRSTSLTTPSSLPSTTAPADRSSTSAPLNTSAFFSQSSGNFVPPLESSYPSLIEPYTNVLFPSASFPEINHSPQRVFTQPPSPTTSQAPLQSLVRSISGPIRTIGRQDHGWQPYETVPTQARQQSIFSERSQNSQSSIDSSDESKGVCPIPSCRRQIKDLKAHMLTHQTERPEKCPIPSCEYHMKGFARKYDKSRHTLTHYKGTMVCGFCPGSGSASEKSFNRADVFKRHLTSVHGVEQTAPNSRRKSPEAGRQNLGILEVPGNCSTCNTMFPNAQEFYDHLDNCVLRVVQQTDPSEAINERLLTSVAQDAPVRETLERHLLSTSLDSTGPTTFTEDDENEEDEDSKASRKTGTVPSSQSTQSQDVASHAGGGNTTVNGDNRARRGLTYSKGGVSLSKSGGVTGSGKANKRRRNYPLSWGASSDQMKVKKRVLCVYSGPRRLWKDDMMLGAEHQVRMPLPGGDGRAWVTDLDVQTLRRAEGLHGATDEEMGPWMEDQGREVEFAQLMGA